MKSRSIAGSVSKNASISVYGSFRPRNVSNVAAWLIGFSCGVGNEDGLHDATFVHVGDRFVDCVEWVRTDETSDRESPGEVFAEQLRKEGLRLGVAFDRPAN